MVSYAIVVKCVMESVIYICQTTYIHTAALFVIEIEERVLHAGFLV